MATTSCPGCGAEIMADMPLCTACRTEGIPLTAVRALRAIRVFARRTREYDAIINTEGWSTDDIAYQNAVYSMEMAEDWVLQFGEALLDEETLLYGDPDAPPQQLGIMYDRRPRR